MGGRGGGWNIKLHRSHGTPEHARHSEATLLVQVPLVVRGPGGVGRQLGAEHSQRLESYFQSIPGVQLVACSTVSNAKALLKSAIRSDNPIIFFEHVLLYNVKGTSCSLLQQRPSQLAINQNPIVPFEPCPAIGVTLLGLDVLPKY